MKKLNYLLFIFGSFILFNLGVNAASVSLKVNRSSIENGSSVTATAYMSNAAAWNITISSAGNTNGCTQKFADASADGNNTTKSFSVTCRSNSIGIISFVLSGDVTASDGTNVKISGSKQVSVTAPRPKSTNNKLKSLGVEGYNISPNFAANTNEYAVTVPSTVDKINIIAEKADSYSSISGNGTQVVASGTNIFEVVVTSEAGVSNTYKLTVNVEDTNPISVTADNEKYTVVKEAKNLTKPELFDETTVKISEFDIPAFVNKICNYTLVGLKDSKGKISLFIYNNGNYTKFNDFVSSGLNIVFLGMPQVPNNYKKTTITINEQKVVAYENNNTKLKLVYGMNIATGKKNYYNYDTTEKTLQLFEKDNYEKNINNLSLYKYIIVGCGAVIIILIILVILQGINNHKFKKIDKKMNEPKKDKKD